MIIKVTQAQGFNFGEPCLINTDEIHLMYKDRDMTAIIFRNRGELRVAESVDEIWGLCNKVEAEVE